MSNSPNKPVHLTAKSLPLRSGGSAAGDRRRYGLIMMDEKIRNEIHDYVWKYFQIHADQRLKTFNFYMILCTLISAQRAR